jgi:hypothetical protein
MGVKIKLLIVYIISVFVYTMIYKKAAKTDLLGTRDDNFIDALFLSISIISTVGYRASPFMSDRGKMIIMSQMILTIILTGAFISELSN